MQRSNGESDAFRINDAELRMYASEDVDRQRKTEPWRVFWAVFHPLCLVGASICIALLVVEVQTPYTLDKRREGVTNPLLGTFGILFFFVSIGHPFGTKNSSRLDSIRIRMLEKRIDMLQAQVDTFTGSSSIKPPEPPPKKSRFIDRSLSSVPEEELEGSASSSCSTSA